MNNEIYYITGGAGFIGRHINQALAPAKILNIDLRNNNVVENQFVGDIRNLDDIRSSIQDATVIIHLAASHYDFEKEYATTNVTGTQNLLDIASEKNINTFVFFSSVAVYGTSDTWADESASPNPNNEYGRTKLEAEKRIHKWVSESKKRRAVIVRPAVVFGPHNYGNLFNLTRQIENGKNFHIGNKPVIKSVAFVNNLAEATVYLIQNSQKPVDTFNYADEPQLTNFIISDTIAQLLGKKPSREIPLNLALFAGYTFDIISGIVRKELPISSARVKKYCTPTHFVANKIKEHGFKPSSSTIQGLEVTTNWYQTKRDIWQKEYDYLKSLFKTAYGITLE